MPSYEKGIWEATRKNLVPALVKGAERRRRSRLRRIQDSYEISLEGAVKGRKYRLFIPRTDTGDEAVVSSGYVMLEIADVVGTKLIRNQLRVSVESLVHVLLPEDKLNTLREMDGLAPPVISADHPESTSQQSAVSMKSTCST